MRLRDPILPITRVNFDSNDFGANFYSLYQEFKK